MKTRIIAIIKPVQFDKERDTYVECTPEQRAEIIRVAKELGRGVYIDTPNNADEYSNLLWRNYNYVCRTWATKKDDPDLNWLPFPEFLARLKGEWQEPTEVTEAHSSLILDDLQNRVSGEALEMAKPDYSHLIGKWVKFNESNAWRQIEYIDKFNIAKTSKEINQIHISWLDITNPRDTNPDEATETRIPFDPSRITEAIRYETRDGRPVQCVVLNDVESEFPVTGYIGRQFSAWTELGNHMRSIHDTITDLFMVVSNKGGGE